jgi:hypothetical protein
MLGEAKEQVGHPPVARWGAESSGDLRPQARGDERLTFKLQGRNFRLTDVHGQVVKGILA